MLLLWRTLHAKAYKHHNYCVKKIPCLSQMFFHFVRLMRCAFHGTLTQAQLPPSPAESRGSCASIAGALPGSSRSRSNHHHHRKRRFCNKAALFCMALTVSIPKTIPPIHPLITSKGKWTPTYIRENPTSKAANHHNHRPRR